MSFSAVCRPWLGVCALAAAAAAQSPPAFEIGANYSYNQLETSASNFSNQSGGSVCGEYFFSPQAGRWNWRSTLGLTAEFSGSGSNSARLYSYLAGPPFNHEWKRSHLFMYGEFEFGGAHTTVYGTAAAGSNGSLARTGFAWGVNDGLGVLIGRHYILNLFQSEFVFLDVPDLVSGKSKRQADMRISAGLGFRFGQR